jgi:hypothetical protein
MRFSGKTRSSKIGLLKLANAEFARASKAQRSLELVTEGKTGRLVRKLSENELAVRPADRSIGKFSVSWSGNNRFRVAFFSRELTCWNKSAYFDESDDVATIVRDWLVVETLVPTKRIKPTRES